jgi:dTDP-D-glucose 4,6-dehydratase
MHRLLVGCVPRHAIGCRKIERELGFRLAIPLEEGLRRTFRWYLDNVRDGRPAGLRAPLGLSL